MHLYLFCLIVGGGLLLLSLLGQDLHAESDHELPGLGEAASFLSLRTLVNVMAFFGLGGVAAHYINLSGSAQLVFALLCGLLVGAISAFTMHLARQRGNLHTQAAPLVGRVGKVLIVSQADQPGKLELIVAGQYEQLLFKSQEPVQLGDEVLIIAEQQGILEVSRWQ